MNRVDSRAHTERDISRLPALEPQRAYHGLYTYAFDRIQHEIGPGDRVRPADLQFLLRAV
jgi:hypothetical protein